MIEKVSKQNMLNPDQFREFAANYGQPQLYTGEGLRITDMTRDRWICGLLNVAHLELDCPIRRRYKYLALAKEILKTHNIKDLASFIRIADEFNKT
jgi:hypothetical protein